MYGYIGIHGKTANANYCDTDYPCMGGKDFPGILFVLAHRLAIAARPRKRKAHIGRTAQDVMNYSAHRDEEISEFVSQHGL